MATIAAPLSDLDEGDERRAVELIEDKMESMRLVSYFNMVKLSSFDPTRRNAEYRGTRGRCSTHATSSGSSSLGASSTHDSGPSRHCHQVEEGEEV